MNSSWADDSSDVARREVDKIDIAGHEVPVVKSGLYDRFRSKPIGAINVAVARSR